MNRLALALAALLLCFPLPARAATGLYLSPTQVAATGLLPGRTYQGPALEIRNPGTTTVRVTARVEGTGPYLRLPRTAWTLGPGGEARIVWRVVVPLLAPGRYALRITFRAGGMEGVRETVQIRMEVV